MKAVSLYSPYGWRAKIGLIIPSTNTNNEPEFWRLAPEGVTIHTSRVLLTGPTSESSYRRMADELARAADELATAEVDVIAYGCTSGSFMCPMKELTEGLAERARCPAITTSGAVVAALRTLGVQRVAVGTPYMDMVNDEEVRFLESHGFSVASLHGLQLGETQEERRGMGRVPPQSAYRLARLVDRKDADAVFLSCTNVASMGMIADIERDIGKPVITSNQATFWACLRLLALPDTIHGVGQLLAEPSLQAVFPEGSVQSRFN